MDRFNLEADITQFSTIADQIRMISSAYSNRQLSEDKLLDSLEGVAILIELHQDKTFDSYKKCFSLDEYSYNQK